MIIICPDNTCIFNSGEENKDNRICKSNHLTISVGGRCETYLLIRDYDEALRIVKRVEVCKSK